MDLELPVKLPLRLNPFTCAVNAVSQELMGRAAAPTKFRSTVARYEDEEKSECGSQQDKQDEQVRDPDSEKAF